MLRGKESIMLKRTLSILIAALLLIPLLASCQQPLPPDVKDASWWKDATFYQIFVRSFADSNGDGKGDFKGLTAKLDYLNDGKAETKTDLGINAIWLMPIHPSPTIHGYDVMNYEDINPDYGSLDDFKQFLSEAHKRGIHVIMDFVINHTSIQHPWFVAAANDDPAYRDYYVWSKDKLDYLGPWGEQVWYSKGDAFYYAVFDPNMPDLNYRNPAVTSEIEKIARFWVEQVGIDGFRIDGAKHLVEDGTVQENTPETHAWFKDFHSFVQAMQLKDWQPAQKPMTVGEAWSASEVIAPYVNNPELDLVFNFDLAGNILSGVKFNDAISIGHAYTKQAGLFTEGNYAAFLANHDMIRVMSNLGGEARKARAAAAVLLTGPGVPFIYYGEEIGMSGSGPDTNFRLPMQWSKEKGAGFTNGTPWRDPYPDYDLVNVQAQTTDPKSMLSLYRDLIQVRSQHYALRTGKYIEVSTSTSSLYAALRVADKEAVLVIINLGADAVTKPQLSWPASPLKGSYSLSALMGQGKFAQLKLGNQGEAANFQPVEQIASGEVLILRLNP
jgi:glycosidase